MRKINYRKLVIDLPDPPPPPPPRTFGELKIGDKFRTVLNQHTFEKVEKNVAKNLKTGHYFRWAKKRSVRKVAH